MKTGERIGNPGCERVPWPLWTPMIECIEKQISDSLWCIAEKFIWEEVIKSLPK